MYCSTCGSRVPSGRRSCDTCGAPLAAPRAPVPVAGAGYGDPRWAVASGKPILTLCPRCAYQGEGLSYFSRGSHTAALVGVTVLTAGAMGVGGLVYYLARREHLVCPRCGRNWGRHGEQAALRAGAGPANLPAFPSTAGETARRGWSILLLVLAAILLVAGIASLEAVPILLGLMAGGGGLALGSAARRAREERRAALIASLQLPVLKLAAASGGRLTVTRVAAELGWTLPRAEKVLHSLDDGVRVDSVVTDEGVIEYLFRELPPGDAAPDEPMP